MVAAGNSGATFHVQGDTFTKRMDGPGAQRLLTQAAKQSSFHSVGRIRAPKVHHASYWHDESGEHAVIQMDYVDGFNPLLVGAYAKHVVALLCWVLGNRQLGRDIYIRSAVFIDKLQALRPLLPMELHGCVERLQHHFRNGATLRAGPTHGDLTFCNVLVGNDGVLWLYDFLDPFIDVVEMDLAKMRQDTADGWVGLFLPIPEHHLEVADVILRRSFEDIPSMIEHGDALRLLNLLRAFPYVKEDRVREHILRRAECIHSF